MVISQKVGKVIIPHLLKYSDICMCVQGGAEVRLVVLAGFLHKGFRNVITRLESLELPLLSASVSLFAGLTSDTEQM